LKIVRSDYEFNTVIIGSGAAGYNAADCLFNNGVKSIAIVTENRLWGTSRNAGSDKQTYYRVAASGTNHDGAFAMANALFDGKAMDGDTALCEAALSLQCFYKLVNLGVPFPRDEFGNYVGYQTDHDLCSRGTSAGPYTSRIMTEVLEKEVLAKEIKVFDKLLGIRLVTHNNEAAGLICLDVESLNTEEIRLVVFHTANIVFCTGGPGGIYKDSVFPYSQYGASGIAFEAGVAGRNLTEWQYGLASIKPRWNVSGSYMQVLPRFISTNVEGRDEKEFLIDFFQDRNDMLNKVFLKGYQWPFDVQKIDNGSSIIDILVFLECKKGRRVFLDFRNNACNREVDFELLSKEVFDYMQSAAICFGTPIERLERLNAPAVEFYLDHGVDLRKQSLEITFCAQHNNGGLAVDTWWQTNISGVFAAGEASGTHGVCRPGGSALNETQVGSFRVADYISRKRNHISKTCPEITDALAKAYNSELQFITSCRQGDMSKINLIYDETNADMSEYASAFRDYENLLCLRKRISERLEKVKSGIEFNNLAELSTLFKLRCNLITQFVYVSAFIDYIENGRKSRGSALYYDANGKKPYKTLPEKMRFTIEEEGMENLIQEVVFTEFHCIPKWRPVKPIPIQDDCFETVWRQYRENGSVRDIEI